MKKEIILTIYLGILISVAFTVGIVTGRNPELVAPKAVEGVRCISKECKEDYNFTLQDNEYSGWQMGCNYTGGSNADWDKKTQRYGEQKYLDCANGLVYQKIGQSSSVTYFNPNDTKTNKKWCREGGVATFSYDNPITVENEEGEFSDCLGW